MCKQHQPPFNVDQQINNLKALELRIDDETAAKEFLNNVSYFRLIKAFGLGLKNKNSGFNRGVTFEQIKGLYIFNSKLRHLLFSQIEKVEVNLRCRVANYFSCKYGVLGYKDADNFQNAEHHKKFLSEIATEIERNGKAAFVKNFQNNYVGGELPFYALVELFSFGTLSKFYKNMKNEDKKAIADLYGVKYTYLENWIGHLAVVRNICAHYGRLYNINMTLRPQLYKQYTKRNIDNYRVFATFICLKHLLPNDSHWQKFVASVGALISDFPCVKINLMGFPKQKWLEILSFPLSEFDKLDN